MPAASAGSDVGGTVSAGSVLRARVVVGAVFAAGGADTAGAADAAGVVSGAGALICVELHPTTNATARALAINMEDVTEVVRIRAV